MKVSNLLNEYFQAPQKNTAHSIVESLPKRIPIEAKKSKWKMQIDDSLSRVFSFDSNDEVFEFVNSLMKIVADFSLSRLVKFTVFNKEVTVVIVSKNEENVSEILDDIFRGVESF